MPLRSRLMGNRLLLLLWICFVLRGAFYSVLFPVWEGYDEYAHFGFVQHVVSSGSLPVADTRVSREVEDSLGLLPLPWMLRELKLAHAVHDDYWKLPEAERARRQLEVLTLPPELAGEPAKADLPNWEAQQPPLYYWLLSFPLKLFGGASLPGRVLVLRLVSVLIASLVVPLAYLTCRRVFASDTAAAGTLALICLLPEFLIDIARVGNESLAVAVYSLLFLGALLHLEKPDRPAGLLLLGASLGLGLITKAYFLTAIPAVAALVAWTLWKSPSCRRRILLWGVTAIGLALAVSGWWYWRNKVLTGAWSGVMPDVMLRDMSLPELLRQIPRVDWANALDAIFLSHIWFGNWSFLQVRSWMYHAFLYLTLLSAAGFLIRLVRRSAGREGDAAVVRSPAGLAALACIYGFFWLGLLYHILLTFVAQGVSASQGWYLYGLVVAEAVLFATGLLFAFPRRLRRWAIPLAALAFGALDVYTVHMIFVPYYGGLIAHQANGVLATFHIERFTSIGFVELAGRLAINKPWFGAGGLISIWVLYLIATLGLIAGGFLLAHRCRVSPDR